jgi:hypothetical protein
MKLQELRQMIREEVRGVINENIPSERDADMFISQVLKLGSKDNLFDKYMKSKKINPDELSTLIGLVADRLKSKWA